MSENIDDLAEELIENGIQYIEQGNIPEAIKHFKKAKEVNPANFIVYMYLAEAYMNIKQFESARWAYEEALKLDPGHVEAWHSLGRACIDDNDYEEAERCLLKATELESDKAAAWNTLGTIYMEQEKYEKAKDCFKKATDLDPHYQQAQYNLEKIKAIQTDE